MVQILADFIFNLNCWFKYYNNCCKTSDAILKNCAKFVFHMKDEILKYRECRKTILYYGTVREIETLYSICGLLESTMMCYWYHENEVYKYISIIIGNLYYLHTNTLELPKLSLSMPNENQFREAIKNVQELKKYILLETKVNMIQYNTHSLVPNIHP